MTLSQFRSILESRGMFRIRPKLHTIRKVLQVLGNPQDAVPVIHIAGTNGKGSVAVALESVLRANGYHTGLYTSPHLQDVRERICVDGLPAQKTFLKAAEAVLDAERKARCSLTYFELLTAMAFVVFAQAPVQIAIVECGLGGLWDATNTVRSPLLSIITSIGKDHTEWLGQTERLIAAQKAGILKEGTVAISGARSGARWPIRAAARRLGSPLYEIDRDFRGDTLSHSWSLGTQNILFTMRGENPDMISLGLWGLHQADNAALVLVACHVLSRKGWKIQPRLRDEALRHVRWPGRLELIHLPQGPVVLLDGAHNPPAMAALVRTLSYPPFKDWDKTILFSAYRDKDIRAMGKSLSGIASQIVLCKLPPPRGADLETLRSAFSNAQMPPHECATPREGLKHALRNTPKDGMILVTGSLALVGHMRSELQKLSRRHALQHAAVRR